MKLVKIFLPIALLISLTIPLCTATIINHPSPSFSSIPALLSHYNLPSGLFPDAVSKFDLDYIEPDIYNVTIHLDIPKGWFWWVNTCLVRTSDFNGEYLRTVTATISDSQVTNLKGVMVSFTGNSRPFYEVTEVKAYLNKAYQFKSDQAGFSPVHLFQNLEKPPVCVRLFPPYVFGHSHLLSA